MPIWPDDKRGAVTFTIDNLAEAKDLEAGIWPRDKPIGFHRGIYETLPYMLDILKEYGLRVTFFLEGWNVEHYPAVMRAIADAGHEIGCHGYRHENWFGLSDARQVELLDRSTSLYDQLGIHPRGFRPPGGITMPATEAWAEAAGYTHISPVGGVSGIRGKLAVIPSDVYGTDVSYYSTTYARFRHPKATATSPEDAFVQGFGYLLDEIAESGGCRAPVSHVTTSFESNARKVAFRRIVELYVADERLWKATVGDAAAWMLNHADQFPQAPLRSFEPDWDPRTF